MTQYGFFIDTSRCTGCNACVIACKQWKDIPPGPAKPIRVYQWEKGAFPDLDVRVLPIMCFHCEKPRCMDACVNGAIYKEDQYGAVLVDRDKCKGDRNCFHACPYGTPQFLSDGETEKMLKCDMCIDRLKEGNTPLCVLSCSLRALDFGPIDELREKYGDTGSYIGENEAPCRNACPGGVDVQRYMNLTAEGKYEEALGACFEKTPFAGVLGRVCTRPCEIDCFRGRFDDAVAIRETKRFLADYGAERAVLPDIASEKENGKSVAIVGGGPAGLSCAYRLAHLGYDITIFERSPEMGGMMRYGIPSYRLPREVLDREIGFVRALGVRMENSRHIASLSELDKYDAIFLATGAGEGIPLNAPGAELGGIQTALDFLRGANERVITSLNKETVVIGGGSVALDAARTAIRLGAPKVHIVCLESADYKDKDHMPAQEEELRQAEEEGVIIHDKLGVRSFSGKNGAVAEVICADCICVRDESGAFAPRCAIGDPALKIPAGLVLLALGQRSPIDAYPDGTPRDASGHVEQAGWFQTKDSRIFAGGDILTGMVDIISAVAAGNGAAESIHRFLSGAPVQDARSEIPKSARPRLEKKSAACPHRPAAERRSDFNEITLGYDRAVCKEQSDRCLYCGTMIPSALIRREAPKRNILPWDKNEAIALWSKRHPEGGEELGNVISDVEEVLHPSGSTVLCRAKLMLKAETSEEKLRYTTDDE